jgi:hypothetical protein
MGEITESLAKLGEVEGTIADLENDMNEIEDYIANLEKRVEGVKLVSDDESDDD